MSRSQTETGQAVGHVSNGRRAVGKRLRLLLYTVLGLVALTGANSLYLASITALEWGSHRWANGVSYQNHFYLSMFALHVVLGLLLIAPFLVFAVLHRRAARRRRNRQAIRVGYALVVVGGVVLATGVLLVRLEGIIDLKHPTMRASVYWCHVLSPLLTIWLYWLHRLSGPRIRWNVAWTFASMVAVIVAALVISQTQRPSHGSAGEPGTSVEHFTPSLLKTTDGRRIPATSLMMDDYCKKCHPDSYEGWIHSVHHFSSFNNPAYRASVRETRDVLLQRDGNVQASRWCAGCHDPVPLLSGVFDQPRFDDINDPTAHAGITCTVCHAITSIDSTVGNADFTIDQPLHYPFAFSENAVLQYINHQLIRAKPAFHKQTFLKPFHKRAEFCSACHKVHLPKEVTHYKDFLRGQNFYDSHLLSGVSGHGARSFYYPSVAETNCNGCHMPPEESHDFGSRQFDDSGKLKIHSHLFPSANTAIAHWRQQGEIVAAHQAFLQGIMRVDLFGIKEEASINGRLIAPLRPDLPTLQPGKSYLVETVIRTTGMGHFFTQGTTDSNEVWLDVTVTCGDRVIGRSGDRDEKGEVDRWAHFVNVFMLDREGRRVNRRNAQDIFVPLYDHQIPPGAAQVVHYRLDVPQDVTEPLTIEAKLQFRKFDYEYVRYVAETLRPGDQPLPGYRRGHPVVNDLPITTLAQDRVTLPVQGAETQSPDGELDVPIWERWNDYGIGLLLEGGNGGARGELRQAAAAFAEVEQLGQYHGPLNLARVYFTEGRLDEAVDAANRAAAYDDAPAWTINWLSGVLNKQQGHLDKAISNLRSVLEDRTPEMIKRRFDFSRDYIVINELGQALFERAKQYRGQRLQDQRMRLLRQAVEQFQKTLQIDAENVSAHFNLGLLYAQLGDREKAAEHQALHARYKPDDNARDRAIALARNRYPAANHAAEPLVIYSLHRAE